MDYRRMLIVVLVAGVLLSGCQVVTAVPGSKSAIGMYSKVLVTNGDAGIYVEDLVSGALVPLMYSDKVIFFPGDSTDQWDLLTYMLYTPMVQGYWVRRSRFDAATVKTVEWVELYEDFDDVPQEFSSQLREALSSLATQP